jgi:hypothetical protein
MLGPVRPLHEFDTSAGLEALRRIWDKLPEFITEGKDAIHTALRDELQNLFPKDNSAIIANAIWAFILLHGDGIRIGQVGVAKAKETAGNSTNKPTSPDAVISPESPAAPPAPAKVTGLGSNSAQSWEDIEISFLSDERVQIVTKERAETRNYAELGYKDGRTGKPNFR